MIILSDEYYEVDSLFQFNFNRLWSLTTFELARLFASKRGLVVLLAFALVWFLIFYFVISTASNFISSEVFKSAAEYLFGKLNLLNLLSWDLPELSMYWLISVYLLPIFVFLFTCDQTCSDRERGTLRYLLLRCSRTELLFGRFLGQVFIVSILIFTTLCASLLLALFNAQPISFHTFILSGQIFIKLVVISLPFIASMSLINVFVSSAKMSLIAYLLIYIAVGIVINILAHYMGDFSWLFYVMPGGQIDQLIGFDFTWVNDVAIPLMQTLLYLLIAQFMFKKVSL